MKYYVLKPSVDGYISGAWSPWYDKMFCVVVCAKDESQAREIANDVAGDENRHNEDIWKDSKLVECKELGPTGLAYVVCRDLKSA